MCKLWGSMFLVYRISIVGYMLYLDKTWLEIPSKISNPRTLTPWRLNLKHPRTLKTLNPASKIAQTCCVCVFVYPLVTRTLLSEFFGGGWTLQRCDVHPDRTGLYQESTIAMKTCWVAARLHLQQSWIHVNCNILQYESGMFVFSYSTYANAYAASW